MKDCKRTIMSAVCMTAVMVASSVAPSQEIDLSKGKENTQKSAALMSGQESGQKEENDQESALLERSAVARQVVAADGFVEESEAEIPETETNMADVSEGSEAPEASKVFAVVADAVEALRPEVLTGEEETETSEFDGYILPVVDEYLNIRIEPTTESEIIGKLYVGSKAQITEETDGWYKIQSGTVEGYVSKEYTVTGKEAEEQAAVDGKLLCYVEGDGLRVRKDPSTEADVYTMVAGGESFEVREQLDGWIGIAYSPDKTAYLSADYVKVEYELGEAVSIEEELAAKKAAAEEAARKSAAAVTAAQTQQTGQQASNAVARGVAVATIQRESISATDEEIYLLACVVHMEAGYEPYEGQLAVANVVLNRLKSGYGSSISEVIYAPGQFSGANTGALAARLAAGPNESSMRAALEALSGVNNIGDYKYFLATRIANYGSYSEYTLIGNHCFYKR